MITNLDLDILDFIQEHIACDFLDKVVPLITRLGDGGYFWIALTLILLVPEKTRKYGVAMAIAMLMNLVLCNLTLKPLIARPRPYTLREATLLIPRPGDHSFPSGHTASSFAAAGALLFLKAKWRVPAVVLAALIGLSRLYLYVHYPTDVLGGMLLGLACGFIASVIVKKLPFFQENTGLSE